MILLIGLLMLALLANSAAAYTPEEEALAKALAVDSSPDPYQLGKGTAAEYISNRYYTLRNARWTIRSGIPRGMTYGEAVKRLADFATQVQRGREWPVTPAKIVIPRLKKAPTIDGVVSPEEWQGALTLVGEYRLGCTQQDPEYRDSRWYVGHTGQALHVAVIFRDEKIITHSQKEFGVARPIYSGDALEVLIRPQLSELYYSEYQLNPANEVWELHHKASPFGQWDVLESLTDRTNCRYRGKIQPGRYCIEVTIPLDKIPHFQPNGTFSLMMIRMHRKSPTEYWKATVQPLLYDPHNIYGYIPAVLE